jgi:leucyl aminopeptidase
MLSKLQIGALVLPCLIGGLAAGKPTKILADTLFLKSLGIKPITTDESLQLSMAEVSEYQADTIAHSAHKFGKCGGFERLQDDSELTRSFELMRLQKAQAAAFQFLGDPNPAVEKNATIEAATQQVSEENLRSTVQWLSQYSSRHHQGKANNVHVEELAQRIRQMLSHLKFPYRVELISHNQTTQKSLRVHLEGNTNPQQIVVLGGHLDSISGWGFGKAPGADDNASGSSNILEALRIIAAHPQPARSLEFFWYAGEEGGLIGSSEIAQTYKKAGVEVIGVMQLDMTLFPGEGELVFGDMTDYTNPWLRSYMKTLSDYYVGAHWKQDECGYGCSDHASWHRQGYAAIMPFEAIYNTMNENIHTPEDVISPALNFRHSAAFAKLAVAFAMDLANSQLKPTF